MRYLLLVGTVLWASLSFAQTATAHCESYSIYNSTSTDRTITTPPQIPAQTPVVNPITPEMWAMAAQIQSNKPPSDRSIRKFCKKHPGEHWWKRNLQGQLVAEGTCPVQ